MLGKRLALASLVSIVALTMPTPGGGEAAASHSRAGLQFVGYRIVVEPQIVEARRPKKALITQSIAWRLRAVYADADGNELLVRPLTGRKHTKDYVVRLNRPWLPTDIARQSPDYADLRQARRRFKSFKKATDLNLLDVQIGVVLQPTLAAPSVVVSASAGGAHVAIGGHTVVVGAHGVAPQTVVIHHDVDHGHPHPPAHAPAVPSCRDALLAQGHHPHHLDECNGTEPHCAAALLAAGHHPQQLDHCERHLSAACTTTLLARGHHPQLLDNCEGVDESCAVTLLEHGQHPNLLDNCKR